MDRANFIGDLRDRRPNLPPYLTSRSEKQGVSVGFDPADYATPADVAVLLDENGTVEVDEKRLRDVLLGAGAHHTHDIVLRARRLR